MRVSQCVVAAVHHFYLLQALCSLQGSCKHRMFVHSFGLTPCWLDGQMGQWQCGRSLAGPFCSLWGSTHGIKTPETRILETGSQGKWIASWAETCSAHTYPHTVTIRNMHCLLSSRAATWTYAYTCMACIRISHDETDLLEGRMFYPEKQKN